MNYSRQRELVLQAITDTPLHHPTADDVYRAVLQKEPSISLATVYRNLNQLSAQGILRKISVPNASDHFDTRCDEHHHTLCSSCGHMADIALPQLANLHKELQNLTDFTVADCHVIVTGLCSDCNRQI